MICPNCGREDLDERKYCPSCGLKLKAIQEALNSERSQNQNGDAVLATPRRQQQRWRSSLAVGLAVMIVGTIIGILGKNSFASKGIADLGAIMAVIGMGLIAYNALIRSGNNSTPSPKSIAASLSVPENQLPSCVEPGSITEPTTRELEPNTVDDRKSRAGQDLSSR